MKERREETRVSCKARVGRQTDRQAEAEAEAEAEKDGSEIQDNVEPFERTHLFPFLMQPLFFVLPFLHTSLSSSLSFFLLSLFFPPFFFALK